MLPLPTWDAPTIPPSHEILFLGSINQPDGICHFLFCNRHILVVKTRSFIGPLLDHGESSEYSKAKLFDVEVIRTLADSIEFGRTNYAYLVRERGGGYRLMYRNKSPRPISCVPWAPLVQESEIEFTRWLDSHATREGVWKGRKVDVKILASSEASPVDFMEREVNNYRALTGLGYAFDVLGLITRNERVVGIMTEPCAGRLVEYSDRAAVYEAVANMQKHGIVHRGLDQNNIIFTQRGIRFLQVPAIIMLDKDDTDRISYLAEIWHWERLAALFEKLKHGPNRGFLYRDARLRLHIFPRLPSPCRGLSSDLDILFSARWCTSKNRIASMSKGHGQECVLPYRSFARQVFASETSHKESPGNNFSSRTIPVDMPWSDSRYPHIRIRIDTGYHPYQRSKIRSSKQMLLAPDDCGTPSEETLHTPATVFFES